MAESRSQVQIQREAFAFAGTGEVYSFTTVMNPPQAFEEQGPYMVALIRLDEGPMITAQITDLDLDDKLEIGDRVEMVTRKLSTEGSKGMIVYGYKFRKVLARMS
jgi:uncharacterized protein